MDSGSRSVWEGADGCRASVMMSDCNYVVVIVIVI